MENSRSRPAEAAIPSAPSASDLVIAVTGITGSGKSTFIDLLVDGGITIGHGLASCTTNVDVFSYLHGQRRVYLIDTPGFDDTNRTDTEVLKDLAFFLAQIYRSGVRLAGMIYLHRITDNRMSGSSIRNLSVFKKVCGKGALRNVVLASTFWGGLTETDDIAVRGAKHENELVANKDWWGSMVDSGTRVARHTGKRDSALAIVEDLIALGTSVVLDLQREMVDDDMSLQDTAAGREVEIEIHRAKERFEADIANVQQGYEAALKDRDEQLARHLLEQRLELENKLQKANEAQESLKISLSRLAEQKTAEYSELLRKFQEEQQRTMSVMIKNQEEYNRLQSEMAEGAREHRRQQAESARMIQDTGRRYHEMLEQRDLAEAERVKSARQRYEEERDQLEQQFKRKQKQQQKKAEGIQGQLEEEKKKRRKRDYVLPVLRVLAGAGTTTAGVFAMHGGLISSGIGMMGTGASGFGQMFASQGSEDSVVDDNC